MPRFVFDDQPDINDVFPTETPAPRYVFNEDVVKPKLEMQKEGILDKIANTQIGKQVSVGLEKAGKSAAQTYKGEINPVYGALGVGAGGVQAATAVPAALAGAAYEAAPNVPFYSLSAAGELLGKGAKATREAISSGLANTSIGQNIGDYLMNNPDAARFMQQTSQAAKDVGTIATALPSSPVVRGAEKVKDIVNPVIISSAKKAASEFEDITSKGPKFLSDVSSGKTVDFAPTIQQIENAASKFYEHPQASTAAIGPRAVNKIIKDAVARAGYQTDEAIQFAGENVVTKTLNDLSSLRNKSITLKGADEIDGVIGDRIAEAMRSGNNDMASKLIEIRDTIRNARSGITRNDMLNPEAFDAWRQGDALWAAKSKMKEMQDIIETAYMTDNPVTGIKTGFRTLSKQLMKNSKGYTQDEIFAINKAAKTGIVTGALRTMGSRLISGIAGGTAGAAGGGVAGALGGVALAESLAYPMRAAANAMQKARAQKAINLVANRPQVKTALSSVNAMTKSVPPVKISGYLPAPKETTFVDKLGRAIKLTESERAALGQAPSEFINPNMTEFSKLPAQQQKDIMEKYFRKVKEGKAPR